MAIAKWASDGAADLEFAHAGLEGGALHAEEEGGLRSASASRTVIYAALFPAFVFRREAR